MVEDPESIDICFRTFKWRKEISQKKASTLCEDAISANSSHGAFLAKIQSVRQQQAAEKLFSSRANSSKVDEFALYIWTGLRVKPRATINSSVVVWVDARSGKPLEYTNFRRLENELAAATFCVALSGANNFAWVPLNCNRSIAREALCAARPGLGK